MKKRIISVFLENQPGALSRVVGLFSQRGYNIDSLTVSPTDDATLSHLTIATSVDEQSLEQILKQLHKLIDVLRVNDISETEHIERELALVKVSACGGENRDEIMRLAEIFRGNIVDVTKRTFTIQVVGDSAKVDAFISTITGTAEVVSVSRSGVVGITRGE